jgi:predicted nuclease of predicted toxin-antitoxin system
MSVKILVDMNLSPDWVGYFQSHGWEAVHWSTVGDPSAPDRIIMNWAIVHGHVVFTHDLDFGTTLALSHHDGPSIIQLRDRDVLPRAAGEAIVTAIRQTESDLEKGALVVVSENKSRIRILPL